ncbi:STAS domain-containing protein [Streptomyces sp. NPDC094038]|uniref:STAS domain-containing protein n=1 Tax=Streptomyces sp. NPDC094038 TaxID=3366055 RepID=UPI00382BBA9C
MRPAPDPSALIDRREQIFVLTVRGEVDHDDAGDFERAREAAGRAAMPVTAVDLTEVTFADGMLLNALIRARHRHQADGRSWWRGSPDVGWRSVSSSGSASRGFETEGSRRRAGRPVGPVVQGEVGHARPEAEDEDAGQAVGGRGAVGFVPSRRDQDLDAASRLRFIP